MAVRTYTNWNSRPSDAEDQIEPYRKYFFICEGANTETFYFRQLIDLRKQLGIHPLIDVRLLEKTNEDRCISYPANLVEFAQRQKEIPEVGFDAERDRMVIVFDADIFEEKVDGYDELIASIEEHDIAGVTNPGFELFLLLHIDSSFEECIKGNEAEFLTKDESGKYRHAYWTLRDKTGMNAKTNWRIGLLAGDVMTAIEQERYINQDIHAIKGMVSSNIGAIIEMIMNDKSLN